MNLFIGKGSDFLNDHMQLAPGSRDKNWEDFTKLNPDSQFFRMAHLYSDHSTFFIIYQDKEIIAILKTQKSGPYNTQTHPFQGINYVSVKDKYQGQGLAKQLYEAMFQYFSGRHVIGTDYETEDSKLKLEKMSYRLAKENKVFFLTRKAMEEYIGDNELPLTTDELYTRSEYNF